MVSLFPLSVLLIAFILSINAEILDYPTAAAPTTWTNSPSLRYSKGSFDDSTVRSLLLRLKSINVPSFAAGFYCFSPCKTFFSPYSLLRLIVVETWLKKKNPPGYISYGPLTQPSYRVVWSANRARPVGENATLELTSHSGLTLRDSDGSLVWSTATVNHLVAGINITESGNLVLFDESNSTIWQSFDNPTDSLVLGQKLAQGMRLTANVATTNWTAGRLYFTLLANGLYAFADSNPPQMYFKSKISGDNNVANTSAYALVMNGSFSLFSNSQEIFFTLPAAESVQFMRLESDGHLRLYDFNESWNVVADLFDLYPDNCAYPTVCGDYGICSSNQYCNCPPGDYFKPIDGRQVNLGCFLVTPISCEEGELQAVMFTQLHLQSCLFQYNDGNSSSGSCYLPSEVFSLQDNQPYKTRYNASVYLKVQLTPPVIQSPPPNGSSRVGKPGFGVILGSTVAAAASGLLSIGLLIMFLRRRDEDQEEDGIGQLPGMPTRFTFKELQEATENFARKLGEGGFGTVFEGLLGDDKIAVKRLDNIADGKKDFLAEVETIGSIHHINLVKLIGFCADRSNKLLVIEYMCNGSLDKWIYSSNERAPLDWPTRYKIITDIAKGLCYLHEECRQRILHLDIKPANILLDEKFNAKISDFGLSKLIDRDKSRVMTGMRGTPGYLAPEWLTARVTEKVDVYSFGVVVMEILSGRKNLDYSQNEECSHLIALLEEKSKSNQIFDLIDKNLSDFKLYEAEIMNVMKLAMWCLQGNSNRRPAMLLVVKVLEGAMEVEPSLDYNFVSLTPIIPNGAGQDNQSAPLLDSVLSGPR